MASYFARVELHNATWPADYISLHAELGKIGFINCMVVVVNQKSINRQLPTGFYYCSSSTTSHKAITSAVKKAADATGYKSEIVVIEGTSLSYLSGDCGTLVAPALRKALAPR